MNITMTHDNVVRCSIALASPVILKLAGANIKGRTIPNEYHFLFPSYGFDNINKTVMSPYFVHTDSKLSGKKRIYINSNGYRMFYLQKKVVNKYRKSIEAFYKGNFVFIDKIISSVSDRWVVMLFGEVNCMPKDWKQFISRFALAEVSDDKNNKPSTVKYGFTKVDFFSGEDYDGEVTPLDVLDPMSNDTSTLSKYVSVKA